MPSPIRKHRADLHVHTALSPCGSDAMTPPAIVAAALGRNVNVIGVVDHNAAANAQAVVEAAEAASDGVLHVLPGIEVQSRECIHVICLHDTLEAAEAMQEVVWAHLPREPRQPDICERQWLLTAEGERVGTEGRLLWEPTSLGVRDVCLEGRRRGALVVAAHVTRPVTGLFQVLDCIPDGVSFDALELGPEMDLCERAEADMAHHPHVAASDAHDPSVIGAASTDFWIVEPTTAELRLALRGRLGRRTAPTKTAGQE
jgi:PHP family Zn ribbon phosphoesterase